MIYITDKLPKFSGLSAELVKINCLFECYAGEDGVYFWVQDNDKAVIALADGNMMIYNRDADLEELFEFVFTISPASVYSDIETLRALGIPPQEIINVMWRMADITGKTFGDEVSSKEIYSLLNVKGLSLPEYPYFAVDYCRRLNRGQADYFALKEKCAAITFNYEDTSIINGIASHQKGYGTIALRAILQKNHGRKILVCCSDWVRPFYQKNGFSWLYYAGYWVKNK